MIHELIYQSNLEWSDDTKCNWGLFLNSKRKSQRI